MVRLIDNIKTVSVYSQGKALMDLGFRPSGVQNKSVFVMGTPEDTQKSKTVVL